jgi:hypothetical protein
VKKLVENGPWVGNIDEHECGQSSADARTAQQSCHEPAQRTFAGMLGRQVTGGEPRHNESGLAKRDDANDQVSRVEYNDDADQAQI